MQLHGSFFPANHPSSCTEKSTREGRCLNKHVVCRYLVLQYEALFEAVISAKLVLFFSYIYIYHNQISCPTRSSYYQQQNVSVTKIVCACLFSGWRNGYRSCNCTNILCCSKAHNNSSATVDAQQRVYLQVHCECTCSGKPVALPSGSVYTVCRFSVLSCILNVGIVNQIVTTTKYIQLTS